ncbi:MAG: divTM [Candidatus Saccharibacteria bacterium]|nr:divTM [Candidatus Saccharibacteria bacterium]
MDESAQNPYIPRESEDVRKKVYERQSPLGRVVKWALIVTAVVAVLVGGALFFVVPRTTVVDSDSRQKLADALQPPYQTLKRVDVSSQLGFHLNYDNHVYSSYAEVGADNTAGTDADTAASAGQTYENNDLRVQRAYNYVRIRPAECVDTSRSLKPIPPQLEVFATMSSKTLATAAAIPENASLSKLSLFVKLDTDAREARKIADDKTVVTIDATKPITTTVAGVEYQKVRFTTTNNNYRISDVKYDDCFYTIQNDQPYSVCVSGVRPTNISAASLVENVFNSLTFEQPQAATDVTTVAPTTAKTQSATLKNTSYRYPLAILTQASTDGATTLDTTSGSSNGGSGESPLLTAPAEYYNDASSLTSIATTQPSVARIGTLYCANLSLKYVTGDTAATITDACVGSVSSGVFISKDGYIATTGHAIRNQKKAAIGGYINFAPDQNSMMDRLQGILDYLLKSKIILQSDADYLKTGASTGDQEALAKIENIGSVIPDDFILPSNEDYQYAIEPTDKPIVVNTSDANKPAFAYSDTVLQAKYVASNYDATKSIQEVFGSDTPSVDVGLLKVSGSFPDVQIASKQTVKTNDTLNILGYPAYADSSLAIDKIRNQPIATTTKVNQVYKKDTGQLIQINNPVLPGNDGAPVVDSTGQLIGLAVYGLSYCPDQQCFASGTVRPTTELLKLLDDNNVNLQTGSEATVSWTKGVNEYFRANYSAAANAFATAASLYPFNVWGQPVQKLAASLEGSSKDTSLMNDLQAIMIAVLIISTIATVLLGVAFFIHRKRINQLQVGHYGAAQAGPSIPLTPIAPVSIAPMPAALDPLPPVPTQEIAPAPLASSESPSLPIREQPPTLPGAIQPQQIQKPSPRIEVKDATDDHKPTKPGDTFYL